ncbi:protein brambleberry-like [Culicoides brevitarsis]|uniref:protein brambleberry-like n=1 Tax=Culicoides brevitarsis TaxID=469753 RepID=UPI00307B6EFE
MSRLRYFLLLSILLAGCAESAFLEYFFPNRDNFAKTTDLEAFPSVPYELEERDEKFLAEGAKLAQIQLSELDMCHHRVILKLRKSCNELNAEQMGKLAVMLLNCQSSHEGRQMFLCSENMSLKDCTQDMSPEVWNAYHLITNRVKAVCATVRHEQFRGLTELTVNKLMTTAHEQLGMMQNLQDNQKKLNELTGQAIDEMQENSEKLISQQNDLMLLSSTQRAKLESNLKELVREKSLIRSGQVEVANLLTGLKAKIDESLKQLETQAARSKLQYNSIIDDLQASAGRITDQIDKTKATISSHQESTLEQYEYTMEQLKKMNATIYDLAYIVSGLQKDFEQKLTWISEKIGGTDYLVNRLNVILFHFVYLLMGMLCLVFVNADTFSRLAFIFMIPINFIAAMLDYYSLDVVKLTATILTLILTNYLVKFLRTKNLTKIFSMEETIEDVTDNVGDKKETNNNSYFTKYESYKVSTPRNGEYRGRTPLQDFLNKTVLGDSGRKSATPFSTISNGRVQCIASTSRGGQCRNAALADGDYCRVHQRLKATHEDDESDSQ